MAPDRAEELEAFKARINLTEYAASLGYLVDRRESSRNSIVMRGPNDDKIVVAVNGVSGHWMYFSIRDRCDNGTIIDFVQRREAASMGRVRMLLRPWIGLGRLPGRPPRTAYVETVIPVSRDLVRVAVQVAGMAMVEKGHGYLERARGIPVSVLTEQRFAGRIRVDEQGNAVFPHFNRQGLCGYELKNYRFTGFAKGGSKGLWLSRSHRGDMTLVVAEGAVDALSYHVLHPSAVTRYVSIGGAMNPEQPMLIVRAVERLSEDATVILATDNDTGGDTLTERLEAVLTGLGRASVRVVVHRPPIRGWDWNDVLQTGGGMVSMRTEHTESVSGGIFMNNQ